MSEIWPAVIGGMLTGSVSLLGQWLMYKHAERKLIVEFALRSALDQWKIVSEKADKLKVPCHEFGPNTVDGYMIHSLALVQELTKTKMRPSDIMTALSNIEKIGAVIAKNLPPSQK
jgi:hypothetical protein